jgi:hypothetical protein
MTVTPLNALVLNQSNNIEQEHSLSKPEVLATSGHGRVKACAKVFVTFILGKVKLCQILLVYRV